MLKELGVCRGQEHLKLLTPADPRLVTEPVVHLTLDFNHRNEVYLDLKSAFRARYGNIGSMRLRWELTRPMKRAMGNAYKHGNQKRHDKRIRMEAFVTTRGVFLSLSDQGDGFDVPKVLDNFRNNRSYATFQGAGFKVFDFSRSWVSFSNGGRTFLLLFKV